MWCVPAHTKHLITRLAVVSMSRSAAAVNCSLSNRSCDGVKPDVPEYVLIRGMFYRSAVLTILFVVVVFV